MRKIKNQNLEQLLVQLKFTPEKKCLEQLDATEKLFTIIDKDKEYPFEFVFFRITGFHPTGPGADELIKGDVFFWGALMAGALFGSVPVAFVYSFFVEHYVSGMTGAVKG